jgi:hypothetical protein
LYAFFSFFSPILTLYAALSITMINSPFAFVACLFSRRRPFVEPIEANSEDFKVDPGPAASEKNRKVEPLRQEQVVSERLARFARIPVSAIFEFVFPFLSDRHF